MTVRYLMMILFLMSGIQAQTNGVLGDGIIIPPDYLTFIPPAQVLGHYRDPSFATRIYRITNCESFAPLGLGGYFANSEVCMFNVDGSYFIAEHDSMVKGKRTLCAFLYDGETGSTVRYLGVDDVRPWWIRWPLADHYKSADGPYVYFDPKTHFYKFAQNELRLYDVQDMSRYTVLRRFNEYAKIGSAGGEGDISDNGRYWCLDGDETELFVYDLIDDIKHSVTTFAIGDLGTSGVDYAAVSANGDYVVVTWKRPPAVNERYHGIEIYDKNWNFLRQVHPGLIHMALGVNSQSDQVIYTAATFGFNAFFAERGVVPGDLLSIRMADGQYRLLKHIPLWAEFDLSACNSVNDGHYLYVSYSPRSDDPSLLWSDFWGEIIKVPTDGSGQIRRLAHHRSRPVAGQITKYWQPDAMVNRQGTKILYRSTYLADIGDLYFFDIGNRSFLTAAITLFLDGCYHAQNDSMSNTLAINNQLPLQSPYPAAPRLAAGIPAGAVDWVLLQLLEPSSGQVIASCSDFIFRDGRIGTVGDSIGVVGFTGIEAGLYFIIVQHRNHLPARTATTLYLDHGITPAWDFTASAGNNSLPSSTEVETGVWAVYGGDVDNNHRLDTSDYVRWYNSFYHHDSGYVLSDLNMDAVVDTLDYHLWRMNSRLGVKVATP